MRGSNLDQLAKERRPLAHALGLNQSELEDRFEGRHEVLEGPHIAAPMRDGDIFTHSYNGGGGYGDPIERDPDLALRDVLDGHSTREHAEKVHAIRFAGSESDETIAVDAAATAEARQAVRDRRLATAMPVDAWIARERERVAAGSLAPEVRKTYDSAMRLSARFAAEFRAFWNLPDGFGFDTPDR